MSVSGVGSVSSYIYNRQTGRLSTKDGSRDEFVDYFNGDLEGKDSTNLNGNQDKEIQERNDRYGEVPDKSVGTTFRDLMNSSRGRKNQIPLVNQIVSSRNPEDGEIYRAFFTDESIICHYGDGRRAWEIDIEDKQQAEKVKDFFAKREPDNSWFKEYYSGDNMGMAVVQKFWLDLFGKG